LAAEVDFIGWEICSLVPTGCGLAGSAVHGVRPDIEIESVFFLLFMFVYNHTFQETSLRIANEADAKKRDVEQNKTWERKILREK